MFDAKSSFRALSALVVHSPEEGLGSSSEKESDDEDDVESLDSTKRLFFYLGLERWLKAFFTVFSTFLSTSESSEEQNCSLLLSAAGDEGPGTVTSLTPKPQGAAGSAAGKGADRLPLPFPFLLMVTGWALGSSISAAIEGAER